MAVPLPALAPVIPPVTVPMVHEKLPETDEVRLMFVLVPLQILAPGAFVTTGFGFTVTVCTNGAAGVQPAADAVII